jgi:hypothetical protein
MEKADHFEPTSNDIITALDKCRKIDYETFEKIRTRRPKHIIVQDAAALEASLQSNPSMRRLVGDTASLVSSVR